MSDKVLVGTIIDSQSVLHGGTHSSTMMHFMAIELESKDGKGNEMKFVQAVADQTLIQVAFGRAGDKVTFTLSDKYPTYLASFSIDWVERKKLPVR